MTWLTSAATHFLTDVSQGTSPNFSKGWCINELMNHLSLYIYCTWYISQLPLIENYTRADTKSTLEPESQMLRRKSFPGYIWLCRKTLRQTAKLFRRFVVAVVLFSLSIRESLPSFLRFNRYYCPFSLGIRQSLPSFLHFHSYYHPIPFGIWQSLPSFLRCFSVVRLVKYFFPLVLVIVTMCWGVRRRAVLVTVQVTIIVRNH